MKLSVKIIVVVVVALLGVFFLICAVAGDANGTDKNNEGSSMSWGRCSTVVIDSCEYIDGFNRLAHKGNCRFCSVRRKKEMMTCLQRYVGKNIKIENLENLDSLNKGILGKDD